MTCLWQGNGKGTRHLAALKRFVLAVDSLNEVIGRAVAWLMLAMVLVTFLVVIMRYVFAFGFVWLQESYVWMHGITFMVGAGYTLLHNGHVRVDVFYRPGSVTYKATVDLFGSLLLMLPILVLIFLESQDYVIDSWLKLEESREAGGLPGLFLLKTVLWVFCALMALQALSLAGRSILALLGDAEMIPEEVEEF